MTWAVDNVEHISKITETSWSVSFLVCSNEATCISGVSGSVISLLCENVDKISIFSGFPLNVLFCCVKCLNYIPFSFWAPILPNNWYCNEFACRFSTCITLDAASNYSMKWRKCSRKIAWKFDWWKCHQGQKSWTVHGNDPIDWLTTVAHRKHPKHVCLFQKYSEILHQNWATIIKNKPKKPKKPTFLFAACHFIIVQNGGNNVNFNNLLNLLDDLLMEYDDRGENHLSIFR